MSTTSKIVLWLVLSIFAISTAHAQQIASGIFCDEEAQLRTFLTAGGGSDGYKVVNAGRNVCIHAAVMFTDQEVIGETKIKNHVVAILRVTVVGFLLHGQWAELAPSDQFTIQYIGDGA